MNNTFDWNRFCKVVSKDLRNLWPMFGTTMLILAALPFAMWLFLAVVGADTMPADVRLFAIEGVAAIAAIMAPSRMYRTWNLRGEGIYFAMLPASKLEKFCSALIYSLIVCPLAVYLGSLVIDMVLTALPFGPYDRWIWEGKMGFPFTLNFANLGDYADSLEGEVMFAQYGGMLNLLFWLGYIGSVMMFFFTATLFRRHKVLQTILWLYVIEFVLTIVLIPVFISWGDSSIVQWIEELPERMDADQILNWFFGLNIAFNVLLIALFGWLSWRRLDRMAY